MYGELFERITLVELANCYPFVLPSTPLFHKHYHDHPAILSLVGGLTRRERSRAKSWQLSSDRALALGSLPAEVLAQES